MQKIGNNMFSQEFQDKCDQGGIAKTKDYNV